MKRFKKMAGALVLLLTLVLTGSARSSSHNPPSRDYLTPQEIELVKDAQVLDQRIDVFIKAAERRFLVLSGQTTSTAPVSKKDQKEAERWGALPAGTRAELITDIAGILDAAIENIDDVALRDDKNPLVAKSLRKLAAATTRFQAQLTSMQGQAKESAERTAIGQAMENAQEILEAAAKLPPSTTKK
ncbi:MAG: hypothetical protein DMF68_16900 [Acidobacteria bacterium]|nr:MAG: hypothetical protein DMF68_16900 [Acidobacteriota bacterium]